MASVSKIFRRFVPQLLHMIVLPIFYFTFMLIYRPEGFTEYMGGEWFAVHMTILSCIILMSIIIVRLLYYFLPMNINYTIYAFWCFAEILFTSFFTALYVWLSLHKWLPYFEVVGISFKYLSIVLIFPYTILALSLRIYDYHKASNSPDESSVQRMRFYDNKHNLKIVLTPDAILYISADENYITITYNENGKERNYALRASMKSIDELCQDNGLVRCHRSYYINPSFVRVLRKEKEGVIFAEMESGSVTRIPVSKKYYDRLSELL